MENNYVQELPSSKLTKDCKHFLINKGTYTAQELLARLNENLNYCELVIIDDDSILNVYQAKYRFVPVDSTTETKIRLSRQLAFMLGLVSYHVGIKNTEMDNDITIGVEFNVDFYLDICSHLSNLSVVSSANTFNFNKIARISLYPQIVHGLLSGTMPFATFDLNNNWSGITIRNPDLNICKLHIVDMLKCRVSLFYVEVVIDFNRVSILN